jgi:hypothetical protein
MRWPPRILFVYRVIEYCVELYHHRQTLLSNNDNNVLLWTESKLSSCSSSDYDELPCNLLRSNRSKLITKPKDHANNKCSSIITKGNSVGQRNNNDNKFSSSNFADCSIGKDEIRLLEVVDENGDKGDVDTDD